MLRHTLRSLELMLAAIRGTRSEGGLTVTAELDKQTYKTKEKVTDQEMKTLNMRRHKTRPDWNYIIKPRLS